MAATAYDQPTARLKLRRRSGVPDEVAKTSAPGSGPMKAARCSHRSGMIARGTPTTRRAALDLGGPRVTVDPEARRSEKAARTRTQPAARSRSQRRNAVASPQRRLANVATSTSARYRRSSEQSARPSLAMDHNARSASALVANVCGAVRLVPSRWNLSRCPQRASWRMLPTGRRPRRSASSKTWAMFRTGRSGACSSPAPRFGARRPHASAAAGQPRSYGKQDGAARSRLPRRTIVPLRPPRLGRSLRSRRFAIALRT